MSTVRKLQRDFQKADLAAVESLIDQLANDDVMTRLGLEDKRNELRAALEAEAHSPPETIASAALFFGGRPVSGSRGIESEFGTAAVGKFQDLVSKVLAHEAGGLGAKGRVPLKPASTLHITDVLRGSFGFRLEELLSQPQLVDTSLKAAVDDASKLLQAFGERDEELFQTAIEAVDNRILGTTREFFELMRQGGATLRLVAGELDRTFDSDAVTRAAERATTTTLEELTTTMNGEFSGALPLGHQFEILVAGRAEPLRGRVDRTISADQLATFNRELVGKPVQATLRVKRVLRNSQIARESFVLIALTQKA